MLIYAPHSGEEYLAIVGDLSAEQFDAFEKRLRLEDSAIRFLKQVDSNSTPAIQRFILRIHRDDQTRAAPIVRETIETLCPRLSRIATCERDMAVWVRQLVRADQDEDTIALEETEGQLSRSLERTIEQILHISGLEGMLDFFMDGTRADQVRIALPFAVQLVGRIYCMTSSEHRALGRFPFEAFLSTKTNSTVLEQCLIRLGDRQTFQSERLVNPGNTEQVSSRVERFQIRICGSIDGFEEPPEPWALEIEKR